MKVKRVVKQFNIDSQEWELYFDLDDGKVLIISLPHGVEIQNG
jgi:hypothetical protein